MIQLANHVGPYPDYIGVWIAVLAIGLVVGIRLFARETRRHQGRLIEIVSLGVRFR